MGKRKKLDSDLAEQSAESEKKLEDVETIENIPDLEPDNAEKECLEDPKSIQFLQDSLWFVPGNDGIPKPNFYKKNQVIVADNRIIDDLASQNLKFVILPAA